MNSDEYEEIVKFIREEKYPEAAQVYGRQNRTTKEYCPPISLENPTNFSR